MPRVTEHKVLNEFDMRKISFFSRPIPRSNHNLFSLELPTFSDFPRLPPEPLDVEISELSTWWLEFRASCKCGHTKRMQVSRVCEIAHPFDPMLREVISRAKCHKCGAAPSSLSLVYFADDEEYQGLKAPSFDLRLR